MKRFEKNVIKSLKHVEVKNLPPTNSAAKYHSYRVYYQVQVWLGNESLHATDWGWELINGHLFPMKMDNAPAPESLLKIMKCGCTSNCDNNRCSCKKMGYSAQNYVIIVLLVTAIMLIILIILIY